MRKNLPTDPIHEQMIQYFERTVVGDRRNPGAKEILLDLIEQADREIIADLWRLANDPKMV